MVSYYCYPSMCAHTFHYWAHSLVSIGEWPGREGHCQVNQIYNPVSTLGPSSRTCAPQGCSVCISSGAFPARLKILSRKPEMWGMELSHPTPVLTSQPSLADTNWLPGNKFLKVQDDLKWWEESALPQSPQGPSESSRAAQRLYYLLPLTQGGKFTSSGK